MAMHVDLGPYVNPSYYVVQEDASLSKVGVGVGVGGLGFAGAGLGGWVSETGSDHVYRVGSDHVYRVGSDLVWRLMDPGLLLI